MYFFGCRLFRERPRQHELGFEYGSNPFHETVQGRRHPRDCGVLHAALDVRYSPTGVAFVPGAIEFLRCCAELHNKVVREILRLGFAAFFAPQAH
jgi:hypothetical protein